MPPSRTQDQLAEAAAVVVDEWVNLAQMARELSATTLPSGARAGLVDGFLNCDRALIMFLSGGQDGRRDRRDITPEDFLGHTWWTDDEEMDQRLRGRLAVMARLKAHLSWERVTNRDIVMWPYSLLAWETTWAMTRFVAALETAAQPSAPTFRDGERRVRDVLGDQPTWPASTSEYAAPRPGQAERRAGN